MKLEIDYKSSAREFEGRNLVNPDEETINLGLSKMKCGAILRQDEVSYVETETGDEGFTLEYQIDSTENHFKAVGEFSRARVTEVFAGFAKGDFSWKSSFQWVNVPKEQKGDSRAGNLGWGLFLVLVGAVVVAGQLGWIHDSSQEWVFACGVVAWGISLLYKFLRDR
jgi:hypothetical protein